MSKRIVLSGGGSGGHITPLLAVGRELRKLDTNLELVYVGERGGKFGHIAAESGVFDSLYYVSAGKIRRYHNEPLFSRILDFRTHIFNIRDIFKLAFGLIQSTILFLRLRPKSVLLKGGFVCVPVSIGAKLSGATIITHDSDAMPGLSNRFAAKFADYNATAMPAKYYSYPKSKIRPVGLPISEDYRPYSQPEIRDIKKQYGIKPDQRVLLITGGSLGARRLNQWVYQALDSLLQQHRDLFVVIIVGKGNMPAFAKYPFNNDFRARIYAEEFTSKLPDLVGISNLAIIRAGATTIAEFAAAKQAVILVPNPDLTGGHQIKNANVYLESKSVLVVEENQLKQNPETLAEAVNRLLEDSKLRTQLGNNLNKTLPLKSPSAELAKLLVGAG